MTNPFHLESAAGLPNKLDTPIRFVAVNKNGPKGKVPPTTTLEPSMVTNIKMERSGIKTGSMSFNASSQTISFQADGAVSSGGTVPAITPRTDTPIMIKGVTGTVKYNVVASTLTKDIPEELLSFLNTDLIPIATPTISGGGITYHINWNYSAYDE